MTTTDINDSIDKAAGSASAAVGTLADKIDTKSSKQRTAIGIALGVVVLLVVLRKVLGR